MSIHIHNFDQEDISQEADKIYRYLFNRFPEEIRNDTWSSMTSGSLPEDPIGKRILKYNVDGDNFITLFAIQYDLRKPNQIKIFSNLIDLDDISDILTDL